MKSSAATRVILFIALCILLVLAYCTEVAAGPARIVVVGDSTYTPFEFTGGQGRPSGITVDIWRLWSKKTGIPADYRCMVWSEALEMVRTGKADVVGGLFYSDARSKVFDFSPPYYEITTHIYFHKSVYGIKDLGGASGFKVGVVHEDTGEEYLRKHHPAIEAAEYPSNEAMVQSAVKGEIKIFICDTPIAMFFLSKFGKTEEFRHSTKPLYTNLMCAGVKKGNAEILGIVTQGFNAISREEIDGIVGEWTGVSAVTRFPWKAFLVGVAVLVAANLVVILWNLSLRRLVASATADLEQKRRDLEASQLKARKNEERFRTVVESSRDAMIAISRDRTITIFNPAAEAMLGHQHNEVLGKDLAYVIPDSARDESGRTVEQIFTEGSFLRGLLETAEMTGQKRDGTPFTMELSVSWGSMGDEPFVLIIIRDITERKKLEAQLLQSQKLEVVGRLAGGVAHELNNLLSPILGYTELMLMHTPPDDPNHKKLSQIRKAGESAKNITRQLLAFGRKQILEIRIMNLNSVIIEFEKILRHAIREDIRIRTDLGPDLWNIRVDVSQIHQVLMNLCANAQDAMPQGGTLSISTANLTIGDTDDQAYPGIPAGSYVTLTISDTGAGMDKATLANIFEPFFTTKGTGRGTGLGLSMVHGIVRQHGGFITASSDAGKGSVFRILLPRTMEDIDGSFRIDHVMQMPQGSGTILVVEDNEILLDMACTMLRNQGYEVLCAGSAEESIEMVKKNHRHIRLLLTDVIMPGMNGKELFEKLRSYLPDLNVVYMSGHPRDVIASHGVLDAGIHFLQKPFSVETLIDKISTALDPAGRHH